MTRAERDEVNERMMAVLGYTLEDCAVLNYKLREIEVWHDTTPLTILNNEANGIKAKKKKKGANKGYKYTYKSVWSGRITRREYLDRYEEIDRKECGLFLCRMESADFSDDRWWEGTAYEAEAIKGYRERIKGIRMQYGLSKSEVAGFMRVV